MLSSSSLSAGLVPSATACFLAGVLTHCTPSPGQPADFGGLIGKEESVLPSLLAELLVFQEPRAGRWGEVN